MTAPRRRDRRAPSAASRAPLLSYRRTFRASIFIVVPDAGAVPDGDGPRARAVRRRVGRGRRSAASPYLAVPRARACSPRRRCSRRRSRRPSRSSAGLTVEPDLPRDVRDADLAARHRARQPRSGSRVRLTLIATVFTLVIVAVRRGRRRRSIVLAIPAAVLTGMAFAAPIAAFAATQRTPDRFNAIFRFGITPLFLFSGTFFPIAIAAGRAPGRRLADAAVPRRRADPRPVARDDRRRPGRRASIHVVYPDDRASVVGTWLAIRTDRADGWCADDRAAAVTPTFAVRQPPRRCA